ncbi:E3 ubiquitin-protein ligase RNF180 [Mycetomoellerius zeteki]|uniref:E3 ubiquitin-protein ligase RNF180 n=1 Tax=Mycetomoellerius zeteki TaxID=64791 RepID=UPI00084E43F4|nr:PREDICTED: E3 ubiquitin-protein ligase RNF180-like [Trachymyrmex zeteki]
MEVRCKHCCKSLFKGDSILFNAHHEVKPKQQTMDVGCQVDESDCCSYMTPENAPNWIMNAINQESWTKGKLYCPYCNNRLGSFNFVNELKCYCDKYVRPPIRIVNSKVDILYESLR